MPVVVGIDLGSTTSKAVVLDEHARVLGRGLTNTRSNYDVAAEVARREALDDARFALLRPELERSLGARAEAVIAELRVGWVVSRSVDRLRTLGDSVAALASPNRSAPPGTSS